MDKSGFQILVTSPAPEIDWSIGIVAIFGIILLVLATAELPKPSAKLGIAFGVALILAAPLLMWSEWTIQSEHHEALNRGAYTTTVGRVEDLEVSPEHIHRPASFVVAGETFKAFSGGDFRGHRPIREGDCVRIYHRDRRPFTDHPRNVLELGVARSGEACDPRATL